MTALTKSEFIRMKRIAQIALVLFLTGCGHAPAAYRLQRQGLDPVLFPPTKLKAATAASTIHIDLKNARAQSASGVDCDIEGEVLSLRWQGTTALVSLQTQSFFAPPTEQSNNESTGQPANRATEQTGRGLHVDPLVAMEKFHADLLDHQTKGCLRPDENTRLRRAIVENLPLPPTIAYFFELGSYDVTGYFDLTPDFRLLTTSRFIGRMQR